MIKTKFFNLFLIDPSSLSRKQPIFIVLRFFLSFLLQQFSYPDIQYFLQVKECWRVSPLRLCC